MSTKSGKDHQGIATINIHGKRHIQKNIYRSIAWFICFSGREELKT